MNDKSHKSHDLLRRQHNIDLIRRMRSGESLTAFDSKASWYPPRPVIKKDEREMARLYHHETKKTSPRIVPVKKSSGGLDEAS